MLYIHTETTYRTVYNDRRMLLVYTKGRPHICSDNVETSVNKALLARHCGNHNATLSWVV